MHRIATTLGLCVLLSASLVREAAAQVPKTGREYYEDDTDLGFKFKPPSGWVYVPPSPSEVNLIGTYKGEESFKVGEEPSQIVWRAPWNIVPQFVS